MAHVSSSSRSRRNRRAVSEMNMVPFIDVMLVLLIIFMVSAPLIAPSLVQLPQAGDSKNMPSHVIEIVIRADNSMALRVNSGKAQNHKAMSDVITEVHNLQGQHPDSPVVISADKSVRYEKVMDAMRQLHQAKIQRIGLAVQPAP